MGSLYTIGYSVSIAMDTAAWQPSRMPAMQAKFGHKELGHKELRHKENAPTTIQGDQP